MGKGRHVAKSEEGRFDDPRSTNGTPRQVNLDSNPNLPPPAPVISEEGVLNLKSLKRAKITDLALMALVVTLTIGRSPQVFPLAALTSDIKHYLVFQILMNSLSLKFCILRIHKYGRSRG